MELLEKSENILTEKAPLKWGLLPKSSSTLFYTCVNGHINSFTFPSPYRIVTTKGYRGTVNKAVKCTTTGCFFAGFLRLKDY